MVGLDVLTATGFVILIVAVVFAVAFEALANTDSSGAAFITFELSHVIAVFCVK